MTFLRVLLLSLALPSLAWPLGVATAIQAAQKPLIILMPGAGGPIPSDFLIRNRDAFRRAGFDTKVITVPRSAANTINAHNQKRKVFIVGMSRGVKQVAQALTMSSGANGAVLISGDYKGATGILQTPILLPKTLVVHHRDDRCEPTSPRQVSPFVNWSRGMVQIAWMSMPGTPHRNPCGPFGAHGFYQNDYEPVSAIIRFLQAQ